MTLFKAIILSTQLIFKYVGYFVIFNETSLLLNPWFLDESKNFNIFFLESMMTINYNNVSAMAINYNVSAMTANYNVSAMTTNYNNKLVCDDGKLQLIIIDDDTHL